MAKNKQKLIDSDELHFAVDIPDCNTIGDLDAPMYCCEYFATKEEAIKWAMENLGADENGMINVVSQF